MNLFWNYFTIERNFFKRAKTVDTGNCCSITMECTGIRHFGMQVSGSAVTVIQASNQDKMSMGHPCLSFEKDIRVVVLGLHSQRQLLKSNNFN